ncbi:MAG: helix-turn-helix transcriptional regulator [Paracoccaceae bacterium]|jgi:predicted DNA-binding transcriptional regulator AlpA
MIKKLINFKRAQDKCDGRSRSAIYEDIKYGRLPKPFKIGRSNFWFEDEFDAALKELRDRVNG